MNFIEAVKLLKDDAGGGYVHRKHSVKFLYATIDFSLDYHDFNLSESKLKKLECGSYTTGSKFYVAPFDDILADDWNYVPDSNNTR